jgi:transcription antitermination factor NusG
MPGQQAGRSTSDLELTSSLNQDVSLISWYAIQTRHRFEKKVVEQLRRKGVETLLPLREEIHRWSDRRKDIHLPLFPGYAFVMIDKRFESRKRVLQTPGLIGFVSFHGHLVSVPQTQIDVLELLLARKISCSLHRFLKVGQRVRIRGGCLHGLEGILSQNDDRNLVISIGAIEHALAIKIEGYELELI